MGRREEFSLVQRYSTLRDNDEWCRLRLMFVPQKRGATQQGRCKREFPRWRQQLWHWLCLEQLPALSGRPPGPGFGLLSAGAIGRNSSSCIHLPVKLRKKHESYPGPYILRAG